MGQDLEKINNSYLEFFDMPNNEDKINDALIRNALSGMTIHLPPEFILADARGKLSGAGHTKVQDHLKKCHECSALYRMIQKFLAAENEFDSSGTGEKISLPDALKSKVEMIALVNRKKDEIVIKVAEQLLPEESWFMIEPAISVIHKWRNKTALDYKQEDNGLLAAAFTSNEELGNKQNFDIINEAMIFVSVVCDLIVEKCENLSGIKHNLASYIEDASHTTKKIKWNFDNKDKIFSIFSVTFAEDE
jgi:hypothetical protein